MTLTDTGVGDNFEYIRHKQQNKNKWLTAQKPSMQKQ